jgi:hypothetical protein
LKLEDRETETRALAIIVPAFRIREMASLLFKPANGTSCAVDADKLVDSLYGDALRLVYPASDDLS